MEYEESVRKMSVTLTIILANFALGVAALVGISFFVGPVMPPDGPTPGILRWIAVALPLMELPGAFIIYSAQGRRIAEAEDWQTRLGIYRGQVIVTVALMEGAALFAGVMMIMTGPSWHAIPAIVLFLVVLAIVFPTPGKITQAIGKEDGTTPDRYS